jgi:5'-3' exonuclease
MNKVILMDIGFYMHRAIFSYRKTQQVPEVYTFTRMLIGDLKKLQIDLEDIIIMACDFGKSWRKSLDHSYKAQRKDLREEKESAEWWHQRYENFNNYIPKLEQSLSFHWVRIWGSEADDIISVACRYYKDKEIVICSSDRDLEQLAIFPNTKIWSPISKKFKDIKTPMKILLEKIQGDISDNLLTKPSSEAEFEIRKRIVDLTQLPQEIEQPIKEELDKLMPKNLYISKIPFNSIREEIRKLYKLNE